MPASRCLEVPRLLRSVGEQSMKACAVLARCSGARRDRGSADSVCGGAASRQYFLDPNKDTVRDGETGEEKKKKKKKKGGFYSDSSDSESSSSDESEEAPADEAGELDPDHRMLLNCAQPLLRRCRRARRGEERGGGGEAVAASPHRRRKSRLPAAPPARESVCCGGGLRRRAAGVVPGEKGSGGRSAGLEQGVGGEVGAGGDGAVRMTVQEGDGAGAETEAARAKLRGQEGEPHPPFVRMRRSG